MHITLRIVNHCIRSNEPCDLHVTQDGYIQRFAQPMRSIVQSIFMSRFRSFTSAIPQPPYSEIIPLLVRRGDRTERESTSQRTEPEVRKYKFNIQ